MEIVTPDLELLKVLTKSENKSDYKKLQLIKLKVAGVHFISCHISFVVLEEMHQRQSHESN